MSAFIVDREHIAYLLEAAMILPRGRAGRFRWYHADEWHELCAGDYTRAAEVGRMLWAENIRSVSYRYPGEGTDTLPGPVGESFDYERHTVHGWGVIDPVQVVQSCRCFSYQSCEHPEWKASEANAFVDALEREAVSAFPGMDRAVWGAPSMTLARIG